MTMRSAWLAAFVMACTSSQSASATPGATPSPGSSSPAASPSTVAGDFADVTVAAEKTTNGGDVIAIGVPRFELADAKGFGPLVLRARRGDVFAQEGRWITVWDAASGAPLRHIAPRVDAPTEPSASLAVSTDGEWLATGSSYRVRLFHRPFDQPAGELACYDPLAFSHDGKLIACRTTTLEVWDLASRQRIAPYPAGAPKDPPELATFAPDNRSLVWTTDHAVLRWEFAGGGAAMTPIYQSAARITQAAIAASGTAAYVSAAGKAVVVDLATGKTTSAPAQFGTAISPSGQRIATWLPSKQIQVADIATDKPVCTMKFAVPVMRIAFGETDDSLVYLEGKHLRVAKLPSPPSEPAQPSRFAGWAGNGIAAIDHGGTLRAFTLATRTWGPADRSALGSKPFEGAPAWAKWVAEAAGDRSVAAEPSKRHDLTPDMRGGEPCDPKLRVWTKLGGTKTLSMPCSKPEMDDHEDPGWEIGGGWAVGVSATTAMLYDVRTGKRVTTIHIPPRKNKHPEYAPTYWQAALASTGDWLALVWRRAELQGSQTPGNPDPREEAMHIDEVATSASCVHGEHGCQLEYFVELWSLKGGSARVWQARLERSIPGRDPTAPAAPSGVLTFDRTGGQLLIGLNDGEIRTIPTGTPGAPRSEHLHRVPISMLSLDAGGTWVFSADTAGEQRLWRLTP